MIMCCCSVTKQQQQQHGDLNASSSPMKMRCLPHITSALLQLKQEFVFENTHRELTTSSPKMKYWKEGKDCCEWDGVTCSTKTGQLIGLDLSQSWLQGPLSSNSSLFTLHQLQRLNLALNNFSYSNIPSSFAMLSRLTHLNLSYSFFSGQIPSEIALLSNMISLDLSDNDDGNAIGDISLSYSTTTKLAQNMTKLEELHLDYLKLSSPLPKSMANLSSLVSLSLCYCNLHGEFPQNIFHLPNIQVIDVSHNENLVGFLPINFRSRSKLRSLNLWSNSFFGRLPSSVKNLSRLSFLDLSSNNFNGELPSALFAMPNLQHLDLGDNRFTGPLIIPSSVKNQSCLSYIYLHSNNFNGQLPSALFTMPLLEGLSLDNNQFLGHLTIPNVSSTSQLYMLTLDGNKLSGKIPRSILELTKLEHLRVAQNNLSGTIEMTMFSELSHLRYLDLSYNSLSVMTNTSANSTLIYKLKFLGLASCNITEFPNFLKSQNELEYLDLSNNKIEGKIPRWFLTIGPMFMQELNLSANFITGWEKIPTLLVRKVLFSLDLSHNRFQDPLPAALQFSMKLLYISNNKISGEIHPWICNLTTVQFLDMSNNNLSGEILPCLSSVISLKFLKLSNNKLEGSIPSSLGNLTSLYLLDLSKNRLLGNMPMLCTLTDLEVLDVSNNQLSHSIPQCLGSFSQALKVLDMKGNNFTGEMPHTFLDGSSIITLDLSHNQLEGMVPQSLTKSKALQILNLGYNRLSGTFPFWLQNLTSLQILILRSNKFHGPIWDPNKYMGFKKLQIVDLAFNSFSGMLSSDYFSNWNAINTVNRGADKSRSLYMDGNGYYQESITVTNKGFERELVRILTIFSCIDLSNNNFYGEIPKSVGDLRSLNVLNLSSNNFEGHIPLSFGDLKQLESLDLSNNTLSGRIPQELATLTFLAYLNLSMNQLMGPIPQGGQFNTFENSSFYGNEHLCDFPLSKECENGDDSSSTTLDHESEFEIDFGWKAVAIGYACGFIGGVFGGYLFISKK